MAKDNPQPHKGKLQYHWRLTRDEYIKNRSGKSGLVIAFGKADEERKARTEDILAISERLIQQNKEAYQVFVE